MSLPLRIALRFALNILLVWILTRILPQSFVLTGGTAAFVVVGIILTILNLVIRPVLDLVTLPLRLVATLLAFVLVNAIFVWLTVRTVGVFDPAVVLLRIEGGILGWLAVTIVFGVGNWLMKLMVK